MCMAWGRIDDGVASRIEQRNRSIHLSEPAARHRTPRACPGSATAPALRHLWETLMNQPADRRTTRHLIQFSVLAILFTAASQAGEVKLDGRAFTIPDGFTIERIAGPPLVDRPITAAFDDQGRLYVADSSGSNDNVKKQLAEKPHRIVRLEDSDGDGKFDQKTIFADKMMFPAGTMWNAGSLYVAAPPSIWKLTDTNGDGVADQRVEWFAGKTLTGCANDLHGPYAGPDGWIYWCKGAFAQQTYAAARQVAVRHAGCAHLPLPPRWNGHRAGHDRRHGQPGRRRIHARRRAYLHHHVSGESRRRPARWSDPRDLRRHLRQDPRPDLRARSQMDWPGGHAGPPAHGTGRPVRTDALRVGCLRQGLSGQRLRLLLQPAQGQPARPDAPGSHFHDQRRRLRFQLRP